ncbi:MAG: F-type H+-transporting ATPase subunit b [Paracoccaceae bacterium]|jgi:F-type H+-transporting ATPase subunit b
MEILQNSNVVVAIAFLCFIGVLVYAKVPGKLAAALDSRAEKIKEELEEARRLREEAQTLLASFERKVKEVEGHSEAIIAQARTEAERAAEEAKADLIRAIERRLQGAADQITAAEQSAIKEVRDTAVAIATEVAAEVMRKGLKPEAQSAMVDASIQDVAARLN